MASPRFWKDHNVFVTGAGGFVGAQLARALVEAGANVTIVLRDSPAVSSAAGDSVLPEVNIVRGSITDASLVERALNEYEVDTCFHLAAQAIVGVANRSPTSTFESNIRGTWTILEACRLSPLIRSVVVASSDKAYGTHKVLPYTEDMPLLGSNPYDASKACTDILAQSYYHSFGLPVAIARCANIYGGGDMNYSRLVPGTIRSILLGEAPVIRSDGTPIRDYLYIQDAVTAYLLLAEGLLRSATAIKGEAFNFGTEAPIAVLPLVEMMLRACGRADLKPEIAGTKRPAGEIDEQYLSAQKAARMLDWHPAVTLEEGLTRTAVWYRAHLNLPRLAS